MLNKLWGAMIVIGIAVAAFQGKIGNVGTAAIDSSKEAVMLCITMLGVMSMWTGIMNVAKKAGLIDAMTRALRPVLRFLFPDIPREHEANEYIAANIIANVLGLGWAATPYGLKVADQIGTTLARAGMITVSGMALGNDGAAHRGALKAGGLTVAVLAGGPDVCYPPQHRSLMGDILLMGAIISEYPPGTEPHGRNYHQRNRIISGLSVASVIVEASDWRSGALITARHALDQGRDVYAVPGPIDAPQSQSCNELIAKGEAALLTSPTVLVREYSGMMPEQAVQQAFRRQTGDYPKPAAKSAWEDIRRREAQAEQRRAAVEKAKTEPQASAPAEKPLPEGLNQDETHIVTLVRDGVSTPEELIDRCGLPAPRVMSLVTMLEMDGILRREKGRLILGTW